VDGELVDCHDLPHHSSVPGSVDGDGADSGLGRGNARGSGPALDQPPPDHPFVIGNNGYGDQLSTVLSEARVWRGALSSDEVAHVFRCGSSTRGRQRVLQPLSLEMLRATGGSGGGGVAALGTSHAGAERVRGDLFAEVEVVAHWMFGVMDKGDTECVNWAVGPSSVTELSVCFHGAATAAKA